MCTAIHMRESGFFGRTLDFEKSFGEKLIIMPRGLMTMGEAKNRYSVVGVGITAEEGALYFDGMNEWGLSGAALNFPGYAVYGGRGHRKAEISSSALLSFVLGFCKSTREVRDLINNVSISGVPIVPDLPVAPLHWIFADALGSITVESVADGLRVYDNPFGVLTNAPDFKYHVARLNDYACLRASFPENRLTEGSLIPYSRGLGAFGLPGDYSSSSRFVRAVFVKKNILPEKGKNAEINRILKALTAVSIPLGCVITESGEAVSTRYISFCDRENLTYYFTTYGCDEIRAVRLKPKSEYLSAFEIYSDGEIKYLN